MFRSINPGAPETSGGENPADVDALTSRARGLAADIAVLQAELVGAVAQLDAQQSALGMRTARWVAWQVGLTPGEARRCVDLARRLAELPALAGAFADGALSEGTVASLASVATPDNEDVLLKSARVATGAQLQRLVAQHRRIARPDPTLDPRPPPEAGMSVSWDHENRQYVGRFRLDPLDGLVVEHGLGVARDRMGRDRHSNGETVERPVANAEAFTAVFADWLTDHLEASPNPSMATDTTHIILHADADTSWPAHGPGDPDGQAAWAQHGPVLSADELAEAVCTASLSALITSRGIPIGLSATRFATPAQRRVLLVRDPTCRYPGCGTTRHLIAHHALAWPHGPTSPDNLVLLCRHHHRVVHRDNLTIAVSADGNHTITAPDGRPICPAPSRPPPRPPGREPISPGRRFIGTGEPLTAWATDEILHHWQSRRRAA